MEWWLIRVWWPWLQVTQRASGNYGKRRVCQGQCLLYSKRLLWNPPCCQVTFSPWENTLYQSLLTLGGCRLTRNLGTKGTKPGGDSEFMIWFCHWKKRMGLVLIQTAPPVTDCSHGKTNWLLSLKSWLHEVDSSRQWQSVAKQRPQ